MKKGILLAGGYGTRLHPITAGVSKQLLPIYDKPMVYYPLSVLMLAGIRDILLITTSDEAPRFKKLLGDGSQWGINLYYASQEHPEGIAQAFLIGEDFIGSESCTLILGDNLFYGSHLPLLLKKAITNEKGATIFAYHVDAPERYGVVELNTHGEALSIIEKPKSPKSNYAVTGLYHYDNSVIDIAKSLTASERGELEISDINNAFLMKKELKVEILGRGMTWLDAGTFDSLIEASLFIQTIQKRQGNKIACLEEIAYSLGYITTAQIAELAGKYCNSEYSKYLLKIISL